ncbi:nucleotidyltransferase domain-containing protein [Paenibacillus gallinarum]|uniref:Nucleotidyltransferase domain-containing protein n=1 Tax=Paenibacillus gallinarum TaxID=2762232 RepID=A0ABR8STH4_9BACL|nr:nucleotidyltransferase domain-containing protein [Paenibacillus gallinarum]MBD7966802.1 nucleotidyltransferase domain-containing protein [Paenibacillus gallinarum]
MPLLTEYEKRRSIADSKAEEIKRKFSCIEAIMVTGSVAIGTVDAFSDLDLLCYVEGPIPASIKEYEQVKLDELSGIEIASSDNVYAVNYENQGVKCEIVYFSISFVEQKIMNLLQYKDRSFSTHTVATGILQSLSLYDKSGVLAGWKCSLSTYPKDIGSWLISEHLDFYSRTEMERGLVRNDLVYLAEKKLQNQEKLLAIWCGLNRMYYPGKTKGLIYTLSQMKMKPNNAEFRMMNLWRVPAEESINILTDLIEDTFDLIELYRSDLVVSEARQQFLK